MLFTRLPSDEELANSGFCREDYEESAEVWPENWPAYDLFSSLKTQWNHGFNGPTGLNYEILFNVMDRQGHSDDEWWQMFGDIRLMETAALNAMRSK